MIKTLMESKKIETLSSVIFWRLEDSTKINASMIVYDPGKGKYRTVNLDSGVVGRAYVTIQELLESLNQKWNIIKIVPNSNLKIEEINE